MINLDRNIIVDSCYLNSTGGACPFTSNTTGGTVLASELHGASGSTIYAANTGRFIGCYITNAADSRGVLVGDIAVGNIIHITATNSTNGFGISTGGTPAYVSNNIVLNSGAGTTGGIVTTGANSTITNNYIEGWSGSGGKGISATASNTAIVRSNRAYSCETAFSLGDTNTAVDNSTTTASGIANLGTSDYTPTSELTAIGFPTAIGSETTFLNIGAIQTEGGAGGMAIDPIITK